MDAVARLPDGRSLVVVSAQSGGQMNYEIRSFMDIAVLLPRSR